jgi:DNA-binding transcriptional MerR regulator
MRDLVRLSGASAPTIHFYAQQGLLPPPVKTAGNQALYSDDTLRRVAWIRTLQQDLRLPLRTIRLVLERWGELPADEVRALQTLGRLFDEPDPTATAEEVASGLVKLEPGDLDQMRAMELIPPAGFPLRSSDARLIELVGAMRSTGLTEAAGFSAANLGVYRDSVQRLVEEELSRFVEPVVRHDPDALRDLIQRGLPLVHQLLALLHQRALQEESRRWLEEPELVNTATA